MDWIDECRKKCKKVKYIEEDFIWQEKPSRSEYLVATSKLLDENHDPIPDLFLTGEYRPLRKGRGEIYTIALKFFISAGEQRRVFMIESYPSYMTSHRDKNGEIFGPHLHLGDDRIEQIVKQIFAREDGLPFSHWAKRFVRHARVHAPNSHDIDIPGPFENDIFG